MPKIINNLIILIFPHNVDKIFDDNELYIVLFFDVIIIKKNH